MYRHLQSRLAESVRAFLRQNYGAEVEAALGNLVIEQPPSVDFGEYALPLAFELARKLRKAPRKIAEEIVAGISATPGGVPGIESFEVAGAGYINVRVNRAELARALASRQVPEAAIPPGKILVEHSSINPNKAAHIGHLRNAILGDTFVRLLRAAGRTVDVQNYIDNTGVQVADVVVGFVHLEKKSLDEIAKLVAQPRFDYYCWDLYARTSQWYADPNPVQAKANLAVRAKMLQDLEHGGNSNADIAERIATAVLHRHLETMQRLGIEYDFLPRESEILRLKFWDAAFAQLKEKGVLTFEESGKNHGCWVMKRNGSAPDPARPATGSDALPDAIEIDAAAVESDQKVIVRSNGTVGYVGKDIAYHMWKFGLLGKDFGYLRFHQYPDGKQCWISAEAGVADHPHFGDVTEIFNVIDARQAEAQNAVMEALRALGHAEMADRYTHFSYEMVALTPRCASGMGYQLSDEDKLRSYIEVSGRKGFGVKADDLLDQMIASARVEVDKRHPALSEDERHTISTQIAVGALRYFMLKVTKNSVIAFDFQDALSFEGETGPYVQYAVVRATNIFRKAGLDADAFDVTSAMGNGLAEFLNLSAGSAIWEVWLAASQTTAILEKCIATREPAHAAKHAFHLARLFNGFYHGYHILNEEDANKKRMLLATAWVARRELIALLAVLGIEVPAMM